MSREETYGGVCAYGPLTVASWRVTFLPPSDKILQWLHSMRAELGARKGASLGPARIRGTTTSTLRRLRKRRRN